MLVMNDFAGLCGGTGALNARYGGATPMLKRRSLFECYVTLPVGTWLVARKQSIRSVGGHMCNLTRKMKGTPRGLDLPRVESKVWPHHDFACLKENFWPAVVYWHGRRTTVERDLSPRPELEQSIVLHCMQPCR